MSLINDRKRARGIPVEDDAQDDAQDDVQPRSARRATRPPEMQRALDYIRDHPVHDDDDLLNQLLRKQPAKQQR